MSFYTLIIGKQTNTETIFWNRIHQNNGGSCLFPVETRPGQRKIVKDGLSKSTVNSLFCIRYKVINNIIILYAIGKEKLSINKLYSY